MSRIELKRIDENNFIDAFNLKMKDRQEKYVSHPVRSLAQAYVYYNQCTPFGIYHGDAMVGYVMVIYDYDIQEYNIWHLLIDAEHQHKGYGKMAMQECLEYIKTKPFGESNKVTLTCYEENVAAMEMYKDLGFEETGNVYDDEIELGILFKN